MNNPMETSVQRPATKLNLSKLKGKQQSTGSISIRFSASNLSDEDELDLTQEINSSRNEDPFTLGEKKGSYSPIILSAPVSEVTKPVIAFSPSNLNQKKIPSKSGPLEQHLLVKSEPDTQIQKEDSERSILSGLKVKFQDPLNALMGRVEEMSNESSFAEAIDRKLRHRSTSQESDYGNEVFKNSFPDKNIDFRNDNHDCSELSASLLNGHSRNSSRSSDVLCEDTVFPILEPSVTSLAAKERASSFEIVDNFYQQELDGAPKVPVIPKSSSSFEISHTSGADLQTSNSLSKGRHKLKNRQKSLPEKSVSMSLSGILSNTTKEIDMEDALIEEEFYDAKDGFIDVQSDSLKQSFGNEIMQTDENAGELTGLKKKLSRQKLFMATFALIAYVTIPLPVFLSGMMAGFVLAAVCIFVYQWLTVPPKLEQPLFLPDLDTLPSLEVPEMKESKNQDGKFKGWMNEIKRYDQDNYHINQTQSVFVQLEGTNLRLQTPKVNIPKRAMWNESFVMPSFIRQRHYDINGGNVYLLPTGLVRKRLWSKKYPICISLDKLNIAKLAPTEGGGPILESGCTEKSETAFLFLFGRTGRDKEEWYRRLQAATRGTPLPTKLSELVYRLESTPRHCRQGSTDSNSDSNNDSVIIDTNSEDILTDYVKYMSYVMPSESPSSSGTRKESKSGQVFTEPHMLWTNGLLGRLFFDFTKEDYWAEKVKDKIQKKLSKIHVPYFIDELTVTGIELGKKMPVLRRCSRPYLDDRGFWLDIDFAYRGGFTMILETKVNLMKLKKPSTPNIHTRSQDKSRSPVTDSDEEDSAESSTDDEAMEENVQEMPEDRSASSGNTSRKLLRIVDKITKSRYFQQATEYKYIKRAMEEVSNTRLKLQVELKQCVGTLAVNIPPPPTDRVWYGFRTNPHISLSAKPKVGQRQVNVTHITDWIERKLIIEFQRVLVMPNMDDVPVPLMCDHLQPPSPPSTPGLPV